MRIIILLVVISDFNQIFCESECKNFKTCGGCIRYAYEKCVWCSAEDHEDRRCQSETYATDNKDWCKDPVYNPSINVVEIENIDFNSDERNGNIVQFKPQKIYVKARPGDSVPLRMSYKPAIDYPLDVYYLMDYSSTMRSHAATLRQQGLHIYEQLMSLTNNVRLGIGSFVEKPEMPLVDKNTMYSYSFKNHLSLTENTKLFVEALEESPIGTNYDVPQAGFDALMQVMACTDEIGWRKNSRRIIVLCSDSTYHSAGDGRLVGAVKPNDMKCHLENGTYTMALTYDYPSVGQINKKAIDTNTKIIFAIDVQAKLEYEALEKRIQGSKYVPLKADSSIVNMIKHEYLELVRILKIVPNVPSFLELELNPDCTKGDNCQVHHGQPVDITGVLKIKSCQTEKDIKYLLKVGPVSLNEKLEINVEVDCECDCEKNGQINSTRCSGAGSYQCGVCECNDNRYGKSCSCDGGSRDTIDLDECKAKSTDLKPCNGRGICRCGKCECQSGFSGDYCEFNDNSCPRPGDQLCAGNGKCKYGRCECNPPWMEPDCQCPNNDDSCIAPISNEVCSGKGECKCGVCMCIPQEGTSEVCSGRFCDDCDEITLKRCKELEDYAYCNYNNNKTICDDKYNQTSSGVTFANVTEMNAFEHQNRAKWCRRTMDDGNFLIFLYYYPPASENTLEIVIQKELELPIKANVWVAVGSSIGVVLFIGLLTLLIWKYLVDLHDAREYKKFENEYRAICVASENPLYQAPAMKFSNPAYAGDNSTE